MEIVPSSSSIPSVITGGSIFSFGGKFRYTGRVEKEVLEDNPRDDQPSIVRSNSLRVKASSVPDTPMTPLISDIDSCIIQPTSHESQGFVGDDYLGNDNMCDSSSNVMSSSDIRGSLSDYFFHESLGHSYSESHLMRVTQRLPRIPKPMPLLPSTVKPLHSSTSVPISSRTPEIIPTSVEPTSLPSSKFHFMKVFWPSFITALMVVLVIIVMLLETDTEAFSAIRQMPEMITLRIQYYEQIKQYFKL